jgi:hypothetical protein
VRGKHIGRGEGWQWKKSGGAGRRAMGAIPEDKGGWKEDGFIIIINFWSDSSITVEQ